MRRIRRLLPLLLVVLLAITLCSCGREEEEEPLSPYVYKSEFKKLEGGDMELGRLRNTFWSGGKIYFTANMKVGEETETDPWSGESWTYDIYENRLFCMNDDGTDIRELENYQRPEPPEGADGDSNVQGMQLDGNGNVWELISSYMNIFEFPDNWDPDAPEAEQLKWNYWVDSKESYSIRKLDKTGKELLNFDTSVLQEKNDRYFYINNFQADDDGFLYIMASGNENKIYVVSPEGEPLFSLSCEDDSQYFNGFIKLGDGSIAVYGERLDIIKQRYVTSLMRIDLEKKKWGEATDLEINAYQFYPGGGGYDLFYRYSDGLYGYSLEEGKGEKLFNWLNVDVDSDAVSNVMTTDDGRVLTTSSDYSGEKVKVELVTVRKVPRETVTERTTLTYACMYMDWNLRSAIIKFNKENEKYRIEVRDYSEYNTEDDPSAGMTKLSTEILAGKVPDILSTQGLSLDRFAAMGYLEDLWPYIDGDEELGGRDNLVMPVFEAMSSEDGKLWQVTDTFAVRTMMGPSSLVGTEPGWSFEELYEAYSKLPEGAKVLNSYYTRSDLLRDCCALCLDSLVDWETGEVNFDGPEFLGILRFVEMFPEQIDWKDYQGEDERLQLWNGMQLLSEMYISDFQWWREYDFLLHGSTFIGFPTGSGNGSAFGVDRGLAMSSTCKNKDGAWEFIRILLTKEYQEENSWNYPTNKEYFDSQIAMAMEPQMMMDWETGEEVPATWNVWAGEESVGKITAQISQEDVDRVMNLIEATDKVYALDQTLYGIINEQCAAFFAGDRSAEDTARLIQSRMMIYVNEQR